MRGRSVLDLLMRLGLTLSVAIITGVSIGLSVLLTALHLGIFVADPVPVEHWIFPAVTVPAIVAPIVSATVLSLAYRLAEARSALERAVATDPLTGVGNRRAFMEAAIREFARFERNGRTFSLLILDIDHFKIVNDELGHVAGDDALVAVAGTCKSLLRQSDLFCRWGGEEFVALLPDTTCDQARRVAEKLRISIAGLAPPGGRHLTCSIGIATAHAGHRSVDDILREADQQLYRAKTTGRNRTMSASISPAKELDIS